MRALVPRAMLAPWWPRLHSPFTSRVLEPDARVVIHQVPWATYVAKNMILPSGHAVQREDVDVAA
jgi:hypothetical protein